MELSMIYSPAAALDFFSRKRVKSAIPGLPPAVLAALKNAGIALAPDLLRRGLTPDLRLALAQDTGLDADQVLYLVQCCDLLRLTGVSGKTLQYLMATGHDTVARVAAREPAELDAIIAGYMKAIGLSGGMPQCCNVQALCTLAREMPLVVDYGD